LDKKNVSPSDAICGKTSPTLILKNSGGVSKIMVNLKKVFRKNKTRQMAGFVLD
jgi:hypothetical protein